MNIPLPLPDELDLGLLGRIRGFHGFDTEKETIAALSSAFPPEVPGTGSRQELLAKATGMTFGEFVMQHTLAPFHFGFTVDEKEKTHAERASSYLRDWYGSRRSISKAFFCNQCVKEDDLYLGYTYWRRIHHLPGVTWCVKHECGLSVATQLHPYTQMPGAYIKSARPLATNSEEQLMQNPVAISYAKVCIGLLERSTPVNRGLAGSMIYQKAMSLGLYVGKIGGPNRPMLNDLASSILPQEWLVKYFSGVYQPGPRSYVGSLNATVGHRGRSNAEHYALASAIVLTPEVGNIDFNTKNIQT